MVCDICGDRYVDTLYRWHGYLLCRACLTRAVVEEEQASGRKLPEIASVEPDPTYSFSIETKESA